MKVRHKSTGTIGYTFRLNPHAVSPAEIIVTFEDGSADSDYLYNYEPVEGTMDDLRAYLRRMES